MIIIRNMEDMKRALNAPVDPDLQKILRDRLDVLAEFIDTYPLEALAEFVVVEPGDTLAALEAELGFFSPLANPVDGLRFGQIGFEPAYEWIIFDGRYYQMVFCFADDGWGTHLIIDSGDGVDPELLKMCRFYAPAASTR